MDDSALWQNAVESVNQGNKSACGPWANEGFREASRSWAKLCRDKPIRHNPTNNFHASSFDANGSGLKVAVSK